MHKNYQVECTGGLFVLTNSEPDNFGTLIRERWKGKVWETKLYEIVFECFHQCQEWGQLRCEDINIERQWLADWEVLWENSPLHELMENPRE